MAGSAVLAGAATAGVTAGFDVGAGTVDVGPEGLLFATGAAPSLENNVLAVALSLGWHYGWRDTHW